MAALPTNPRLATAARAVLAEPTARVTNAAVSHLLEPSPSDSPFGAWQRYLTERGWLSASAMDSADNQSQLAGLAVLSAALTFPAAIARSWDVLTSGQTDRPWRLHAVGARAEAALPVHIWSELSLLTGAKSIDLEFSGPAAAPKGVDVSRAWVGPDGHHLHLKLTHPDLFHRSELGQALLARARADAGIDAGTPPPSSSSPPPPSSSSSSPTLLPLPLPDAFVLFNPGLGEPGWERAWSPTMRALLASGRPILMTALSRTDAARDAAFLEQMDWGHGGGGGGGGGGGLPLALARAEAYADSPFPSLLSASGDGLVGGAEGRGCGGAGGGVAATGSPQSGGRGAAANSCFRVLLPK